MTTPLKIIDELRKSDEYIETIFKQGSCYRFHLFLKALFPTATPLINRKKDHVVSEINGRLYDITGVAKGVFYELDRKDLSLVESWSFKKNRALVIKECPVCEEPLLA